jgi:hypothetical protein
MSGAFHRRRGPRRFVIRFLLLLLPVAAWSLWDYVEARRLSTVVREIQSRGEPIASNSQPRVPQQFHVSAGAYYDAAAMLMDRSTLSDIEAALYYERGERAALMARLRSWLDANAESERMLDQATAAEFRGFQAYQDWLRVDRLVKVSSLARARVVERLDARDGDGAAAALIRQIRIARGMEAAASDWAPFFFDRALADLDQLLAERPSPAALERLQQAIRVNDRDGVIREDAINARGLLIESLWNPGSDWYGRPSVRFSGNPLEPLVYFIARPWQARRVTYELARMNAAVAAASTPWPDRLKFSPIPMPTISASRWRFFDTPADTIAYLHQQRTLAFGRMLAILRTAECAVAVERLRAAHGGTLPETLDALVPAFIDRVPVDPFSGAPLKLRSSPFSYAVYSVGGNFVDDGGTALKAPRTPATGNRERPELAPDYGIAVTLEPRSPSG